MHYSSYWLEHKPLKENSFLFRLIASKVCKAVKLTTEEQWMFSLAHGDKIQIQKDPY